VRQSLAINYQTTKSSGNLVEALPLLSIKLGVVNQGRYML